MLIKRLRQVNITVIEDGTPILLSSLPRSGSTWVMKMLEASGELTAFHEPDHLNQWSVGDGGMHPYIPPAEESAEYYSMYKKVFSGVSFRRAVPTRQFFDQLMRMARVKVLRKRVLVKSVYNLHNLEWISNRFDVRVVILLRHPAAIAHSIHRRWPHAYLKDPQNQTQFVGDYLGEKKSILDEASGIYEKLASRIGAYYRAAEEQASRHPEWIVVYHEDLCTNSLEGFQSLFEELTLPGFDRARAAITSSNAPKESDEVEHVKRVAAEEVEKWKSNLDQGEIQQIAESYSAFSNNWYPDFGRDADIEKLS